VSEQSSFRTSINFSKGCFLISAPLPFHVFKVWLMLYDNRIFAPFNICQIMTDLAFICIKPRMKMQIATMMKLMQ